MAAVMGPEGSSPPPPRVGKGKRRWWVVGLVLGWAAVLAVWSVGQESATVPEQRDIADAVPELQRAVGVVFQAADGDGRALVLGELELIEGCRITPVRKGVVAARDLTVYVRAGEAREAFDAIAAGLPAGYQAEVTATRGGTRLGVHADAGNFVGIDSSAESTATVLTLRLSSGCRPRSDSIPGQRDPSAGAPPGVFDAVVSALGGAAAETRTRAVDIPDGGVAVSWSADVDEPQDLLQRLRNVSAGASLLRSDGSAWAYRSGGGSVVVVPDGTKVRVTVSAVQ